MKKVFLLLDFEEIGICLTTHSKKVLFQNNVCKRICGDQFSNTCNLCKDFSYNGIQSHAISRFSETKVFFSTRQILPGSLCDIYKYREKNNQELTILIPITMTLKKYIQLLESKGFTSREVEISILLLDKKSNIDIQQELFISKSTLKTHLNHIYSKYPNIKLIRSNLK